MAKKDNKSNKENKHFFRDFKAEIKKVIWPTPKQLVNNTIAIVTMVIIVGVIVFVLDLAFDAVNKYGLTNLQKSVQSVESQNTSGTETDSDSDNSEAEATVEGEAETQNTENE